LKNLGFLDHFQTNDKKLKIRKETCNTKKKVSNTKKKNNVWRIKKMNLTCGLPYHVKNKK